MLYTAALLDVVIAEVLIVVYDDTITLISHAAADSAIQKAILGTQLWLWIVQSLFTSLTLVTIR